MQNEITNSESNCGENVCMASFKKIVFASKFKIFNNQQSRYTPNYGVFNRKIRLQQYNYDTPKVGRKNILSFLLVVAIYIYLNNDFFLNFRMELFQWGPRDNEAPRCGNDDEQASYSCYSIYRQYHCRVRHFE